MIGGPPYPEVVPAVKLHKLESLNLYESTDFSPAKFSQIFTPLNFCEFMAWRLGMFAEPFTFSIRAYRKLQKERLRFKFDIVHDNQGLGYGLLLTKRLKVPVITTIHHPIPIDRELSLAQAKNLWEKFGLMRWYSFCAMQRLVAERMDRVITVSQSSAEETRRIFKVPQSKIRVVYNGVDSNFFKRDDNVLKEPNSLIVINSGQMHIKGTGYLLKGLQLLRKEMKVKLTIVATDTPDSQYARLVKEYGLDDIVTFTGKIDRQELVRRYSAAEVAVVPSLYEGFGLPAAEAMSCKLPVIAAKAGALPEVVGEDGDAGIFVPPADANALAAAIKRLLSDELLRRKMGEAGRERMKRNFTWEQAAKKTLAVYEELL